MFSVLNSCRAGLRSAARPSRAITLSLRANSSTAPSDDAAATKEQKNELEEEEDAIPQEGEGLKLLLSQAIKKEDTEEDDPIIIKNWMRYEVNDFLWPYQYHRKYRKRRSRGIFPRDTPQIRREDPFVQLGVDPRQECDNRNLLTYWNTTMGKIPSHKVTGLTMKSHRMYAKALKWSKQMGVTPIFSNK